MRGKEVPFPYTGVITRIVMPNNTVEIAYVGPDLPQGVSQGDRTMVNVRNIRPFICEEKPVMAEIPGFFESIVVAVSNV